MRLKKRVVAISGAGSGIGRACALAMAREGADLALADINLESVEAVSREITALGRRTLVHQVDVTAPAELARFVQRTATELGALDVWVGSAGMTNGSAALDIEPDEWRALLDVNLGGVVFGAQAAARHMVANGGGAIINLASMYGVRAVQRRIAYCTSKAAVIMATQCLAVELATHNVRVNAIGPGYTDTPMFRGGLERSGQPLDRLLEPVPMGRLGSPEEIADVAVFLASDESRFVTGHCLMADGGWSVNGSR